LIAEGLLEGFAKEKQFAECLTYDMGKRFCIGVLIETWLFSRRPDGQMDSLLFFCLGHQQIKYVVLVAT
jgi:hypothetical protein